MKILLFLLLLVAPASLAACGGAAPAPSNSGGGQAKSAPAAPAPVENLPKIVAFGDSLTAGYGLPLTQSYPSLLQKKLDADGFKYEVVNAGVSGDTSAAGLRRIDWTLDAGGVRILILELGANDFLRGQPVAETRKNLSQIIERAKSRGVTVLLAGMYTTEEIGRGYESQVAQAYQSLAREHDVALIPFFLEGVAGRDDLNQDDRIHPNAEGTKIVADTVYRHLKPLLEKEQENN